MPGVRRTAAFAAVFLLSSAACALSRASWAAAEAPPQHMLPAGTAVVFVTDAALDAGRREGDVVSVHLRDNLVLDGTVLAPAGTRAQLIVGGVAVPGGQRRPVVSLDRFAIPAGLMPVKAIAPIQPPVPAGALIEATTLAEIDRIGDRVSIRIPFPFRLSGDQPASAYTPTPARTAPARINVRPSARPSPTAAPTAAATPDPSATPPAPEPVATKIPGR